MPARLSLQASTHHPAGLVPMLVSEAVQAAGGWASDVHKYGELQVVVAFEIPNGRQEALRVALETAGVRLHEASWQVPMTQETAPGAITVTLRAARDPIVG